MLYIKEMLHLHSEDSNEIYKIILQNMHQYFGRNIVYIMKLLSLLSIFRNHKTDDMHYLVHKEERG